MTAVQRLTGIVAAALIALALWQLEAARAGLAIAPLRAGETPATVYRQPGTNGPLVVIAHGFAGSRQLMEAFALTLAQAGYTAVSFDFQGHGRNPVPMSGDLTEIEGATRRLVAETAAVIDAARDRLNASGPVALLGHSMATDIVVRQTIADPRIAAVVAVSMYSEAVTADLPKRLLVITGAWEPGLRRVALDALRRVDPQAEEGETATSPAGAVLRRAVVAPMVEHVGVLYSTTSLREARAWIDAAYGRRSSGPVATTGGWIALLLGAILLLAWPLAALLPEGRRRPETPIASSFAAATLVPAVLTPLLLYPLELRLLPVLVADYLTLHLLVYGLIALALLKWRGLRFGRLAVLPACALAVFGIGVFGLALDRYAASFVPHLGRVPVILALAVGAVPFMLADSLLTEAGRARLWRRVAARLALLASLGLAVALDFERLFFLIMVLPVIVLFFLIFGLMGRWVGRRSGTAMAPGLALGLILAWALGVTFPLVAV
ncbi:alpha/beta hydrolase [Pelagibius sp.]|uniref:alpha/beta hydrolase n=1 Tax=Pelagibius sp. TaxID=1931238 RepID=UPI00262F834C|nr:alpha/beta fold hydrolase [Pelagibius sp.]